MPKYPHHINCKCRLNKIPKPIPNVTANAFCDIRKFTEYVFSETKNQGKKAIFESLGYTIDDSEYLQNLFTSQAIQKYCNGEYVLKTIDRYAIRIEILIDINTKDGTILHIKTGWNLLPNGKIKMSTPFSGFTK